GQGSGSGDQKYVGEWVGSYSTDNGNTDKLSYNLSRGEKGQWLGTVKWINSDGEQSADFKSLQIADGKMKGKIESPDGQVEIAIEDNSREINLRAHMPSPRKARQRWSKKVPGRSRRARRQKRGNDMQTLWQDLRYPNATPRRHTV